MSPLTELFTPQELRDMLRDAYAARQVIATKGGLQEVRTRDQLTRFHPANIRALDEWIADLEAALGLLKRARSRPVYF